ncbi:MAG: M20/M25/M40 family metallo-hydrolase [Candidatus Bathyarchaeota archaeon]|nr:MAG: M20/M25/M40 family metallo-hydrolase [Candidatus Bathyarchaeota archaeon]
MVVTLNDINKKVEERRDEAVSFLQELIGAPSPSGEEAEAARVVADKMRGIGFDAVEVDGLNDAKGTIKGTGDGRSILFNGHIDHVPVGGMVDPYSGKLMDGAEFGVEGDIIYGRASSDMKGAVAAMVMAGAVLKDIGVVLRGDFKVAAVALEEVGGAGTMETMRDWFLGDVVVSGEATNMEIALGHRGGAGTSVVVKGRSCHASAPERGVNALYKAIDIIDRIRSDLIPRLPDHQVFGKTTLAVTRISVKPDAGNVVPEECTFHMDCRTHPDYPREALKADLEGIIASMRKEDPELEASVAPPARPSGRNFGGYYTDPEEHPVVLEAKEAIAEALVSEPKIKTWRFITDGRHYAWLGIPVIGFGPGEERFAHTHQDHVRVEDYLKAIVVYAWLACRICGVE